MRGGFAVVCRAVVCALGGVVVCALTRATRQESRAMATAIERWSTGRRLDGVLKLVKKLMRSPPF
jgi:hypothetical protein